MVAWAKAVAVNVAKCDQVPEILLRKSQPDLQVEVMREKRESQEWFQGFLG